MRRSERLVRVAGVGVCLASALALTSLSPSASATTTTVVCGPAKTANDETVVSCLLPSGLSSYSVTALLSAAQASSPSLTTSTPMVITAFGGAGNKGDEGGGLYSGGSGGKGGTAQTITSVSDYQSSFGTTLYYYVGNEGGSTSTGGRGGASTLVSGVDLTTQAPCISGYSGCTTTTLLADAGGGGGGEGNADGGGGAGGDGGIAVSGEIFSTGADGKDGGTTSGGLRTGAAAQGDPTATPVAAGEPVPVTPAWTGRMARPGSAASAARPTPATAPTPEPPGATTLSCSS